MLMYTYRPYSLRAYLHGHAVGVCCASVQTLIYACSESGLLVWLRVPGVSCGRWGLCCQEEKPPYSTLMWFFWLSAVFWVNFRLSALVNHWLNKKSQLSYDETKPDY